MFLLVFVSMSFNALVSVVAMLILPKNGEPTIFREEIAAGKECILVLEKFARPQNPKCEVEQVRRILTQSPPQP